MALEPSTSRQAHAAHAQPTYSPHEAHAAIGKTKRAQALLLPSCGAGAQVWEMANTHRVGYLDRLAFHKAMDLIGMAQQVMQACACYTLPRWTTIHAALAS